MIREIALDTETTGLKPEEGHRIVEIAAVELVNHVPTGREFSTYVDPERPMDPDASRITGIVDETLAGKPRFADIIDEFLAFVGDAPLVIHNAAFDMAFLRAEFEIAGRAPWGLDRAIDTLAIAKRRYPGAPASLDALCKRFGIDTSERVKHGALIDTRLLAAVYLELVGGRQPGLLAADAGPAAGDGRSTLVMQAAKPRPAPLPPRLTAEEAAAHEAFVAGLKGEPLWTKAG